MARGPTCLTASAAAASRANAALSVAPWLVAGRGRLRVVDFGRSTQVGQTGIRPWLSVIGPVV